AASATCARAVNGAWKRRLMGRDEVGVKSSFSWQPKNVALALACLVALGACESPSVSQPVQFNHAVHVKALQCNFCHQYVEKAGFAGIPSVKVCATCHRGKVSGSEEAEKVRAFVKEHREIPWQRIYRVPSYVNFSHRRHVLLGGLQCESCHGNLRVASTPQARPAFAISMNRCMACHEERKVDTDCLTCHH